jgi:drug/metabolite transporter (DMT)-like permease
LSFCTGNFLSARLQTRGVPIASTSAWGMLYGAGFLALYSALSGLPFTIETTPLYIGSLLWSALVSSVLAFGAYLSLLGRIGPARAGYLTVLIPVFALAISAVLEGYTWTLWSFLGLAAVGVGNVLVLRRGCSFRRQRDLGEVVEAGNDVVGQGVRKRRLVVLAA